MHEKMSFSCMEISHFQAPVLLCMKPFVWEGPTIERAGSHARATGQLVQELDIFTVYLTNSAINGESRLPTLAHIDPLPTPTFRTTVGKISAEYT